MNFEKETEVYRSCGATLNGQNWIIGGYNEKIQVIDELDDPIKVKRLNLDQSYRWMQY